MPPASDIRKTTRLGPDKFAATETNASSSTKRTASGRAVRANANRPANYYARPFGSFNGANAGEDHDSQDAAQPPGFFPALQYLSDAITALPREVVKQFTLMKEVEAKVYSPSERLGELVDRVMEMPVPARRAVPIGGVVAGGGAGPGMLSLTASNSAAGSANASLINGVAGQHSAQNSVAGSVVGEDETEEDLLRRKLCLELRLATHALLPNLDEKNVVLTEANRVLSLQLARVDSVMPHVDNEISEEARLGSMTHWAYSDNRQKKQVPITAAGKRDVAGTNSLMAAANAIHETDIAQARRDAGREATIEKRGKGKRQEQLDSDFDDKPRKAPKGTKSKASGLIGPTGLGISTNGEPVKRRKVDKGLAAPGMERSFSSTKGSKAARETPRSTPAAEPSKKATKAKPTALPPKKRMPSSAQASPMLASSPLHSSFVATGMEPPPGARPTSARIRQNSTTNLRHERLMDGDASRPTTAASKTNGNGEKANGKRKASQVQTEQGDTAEGDETDKTADMVKDMKREDVDMTDADRPAPSRSASNSGKAGRASKVGTPRTENFPDAPGMVRTRSTRSLRNTGSGRESSDSAEPQTQGRPSEKHKRNVSSHLVKQLAPFNRSPDLDRHKEDDMDDDAGSVEGREPGERRQEAASEPAPQRSRPVSRRNTQTLPPVLSPVASPPPLSPAVEAEVPDAQHEPELSPDLVSEPESDLGDHDDPGDDTIEGEIEQEPNAQDIDEELDDADMDGEEQYCYCGRGSFGEMVACDNTACQKEWFHLECTELREAPGEDETWYCKDCRPLFTKKRGGKGGGGRGRG